MNTTALSIVRPPLHHLPAAGNPAFTVQEPGTGTATDATSLDTFDRSGVRFAAGTQIERSDTLHALMGKSISIGRCINADIELNQRLYANIAVVQCGSEPKGKVALLFVTDAINDLELSQLCRLIHSKGWSLPESGPQAWLVTTQIAVSLAQGHLVGSQTATATVSGADKSTHLWQSVVDLTQWAVERGANDIDYILHTEADTSQVAFKIDGQYVKPGRWRIPTETMKQMLQVAWQFGHGGSDANFLPSVEQQATISMNLANGQKVRLRWSGWATDKGTTVTQRIQRLGQSQTLHSLEQAGCLPWQVDTFTRVLHSRGGITTLAGEVGSGKSNTLAILMRMLPDHFKIIEVSSPVEIDLGDHVHQKTILQNLMKTGDNAAFASAVRGIFRSAMDKVLIGEIRDQETGMLARAITESGHSSFTTTHAANALGVFFKYASPQIGIPLEVLAAPGNVRLNVFQSLLPSLCDCKHTLDQHLDDLPITGREATQHYFDRIERLYRLPRERFRLRSPRGCPKCQDSDLPMFTGLAGRTLAMEMVEPDVNICELLQNNDRMGLSRYWRSLASPNFDDAMLAGKTAMECALFKAQLGQIDPRDVELHFESFETVEYQRQRAQAGTSTRKSVRTSTNQGNHDQPDS